MKKQKNTLHIALHTSQKGITLIALIITIIVMLILVGVTINIALNGGLFDKASDTSKQMQIEAEKEELLSAVMGAIENDGKIKFENIELPTGWSESNGTYISPKGNAYKVDEYGKITHIGEGEEPSGFDWTTVGLIIDTDTEYTANNLVNLNFSRDGVIAVIVQGKLESTIDAKNQDNIVNGKINCLVTVLGTNMQILLEMNENNKDINLIINGKTETLIKIETDNKKIYSNKEVLKALGITNYTGTYTGTWIKIGEENGKIKLLSAREIAYYTLGSEDPKAIEAIPVLDENALTAEEKNERRIWSIKNAKVTLDTLAQEITGIPTATNISREDFCKILGEENVNYRREEKSYRYYFDENTLTVWEQEKTGEENGDTIWSNPTNLGVGTYKFLNANGEIETINSAKKESILTYEVKDIRLTEEQEEELTNLFGYTSFWIGYPYITYKTRYSIDNWEEASLEGAMLDTSNGVRAVISINM